MPPVPSPARISASPVWALHSCAGGTHGPGMCRYPLRGRYAWPRRKIPVRALRMAPGMLQLCVSAMWHKCCARPAQDPALPHSASSQSDARPSQLQRETTLRAARPVSGLGLDAIWGARAQHTVTQAHRPTATRYTPCRLPARNPMPRRTTGGLGPQADRLTGTGLGDVAVRLRRASLRPGPATADGFARLRLRRQAPDIPGRWSRATGTWHMTPRDSPWGGTSHPHRRG